MVSKMPPKNVALLMELRKRCPRNQIHHLENLFAKRQHYKENLRTLKKSLPIIDWDYYKRNVRSESLAVVEELEKKYTSFSVPYPTDIYTKQFEQLKEDVKVQIAEFKEKSNERIAAYEKEMQRIRSLVPFDQMTWEDYCDMYPEEAPDFINRPTFWPHNPEEQIQQVESQEQSTNKTK
ncbi:ATP synthase subunit d, mitochondrial-like [Episyrphus balteatus]|uniref:ATP synthase subunit d, mitochondrial-like n=1 Tax=Episyrphus balteatus TaxID=286459 RepID=UPI0024857FDB|nr:ATP synthase subunit d, mitochondrial-like [Episyrphus balteatus]